MSGLKTLVDLANLDRLEILGLNGSRPSDGDLRVLTSIPSLKHLTFHDVPRADVDKVASSFRGLTLRLGDNYLVGNPQRFIHAQRDLPDLWP